MVANPNDTIFDENLSWRSLHLCCNIKFETELHFKINLTKIFKKEATICKANYMMHSLEKEIK